MFQLKKRKDGNRKRSRFMFTICFYQDTKHEQPLYWIRNVLKIGYVSRRKDGMSELRINGHKQTEKIISDILPFLKFKKIQAKIILDSVKVLLKGNLTNKDLRKLVDNIIKIQSENYVTKRKRNKEELLKALDLTP